VTTFSAVAVEGLVKEYPPARPGGESHRALDGLSLTVFPGEIFGVLGPNGGGKTTLFRILSTGLRPTAGTARVLGLDVMSQRARVREKIGVVFQHPSLDKELSLEENMIHQGRLYGLSGRFLHERVGELLGRLSLADRSRDRVKTLSGGLQRRGEVAKGLLQGPELLLLDEPSTGLDPGARRDLWAYLAELKGEGVTVLVTTHLMEEAERCDRLLIVHRGRAVALGTPSALKEAIGGDVISAVTRDGEALARGIKNTFSLEASRVDGTVRVERARGHEFVPQLVEAFPGLIDAVSIGKPTLEDVFIHKTGRRFFEEGER
jgi:ABC-2 type transport system ATP-binding protein